MNVLQGQHARPGAPPPAPAWQRPAIQQPGASGRQSPCHHSPLQSHTLRRGLRCRLRQPLRHEQSEGPTETQVRRANSGYGADDVEARRKNREPPTLVMRVLAAVFYIVPWMDICIVGAQYHHRFPTSVILHLVPAQFLGLYYSSQFAPLIIFFLLFLSVVKNFRLHHFTRFHCMQAVVLDIVTMLFTLVRQYLPSEIRWSYLMHLYDMFAYNACLCTILYCVFFALAGHYANVTYVSESTYMQVEEGT